MMTEIDEAGAVILRNWSEKYPSLTFSFVNNAICVRMRGFWAGVSCKVHNDWVDNAHVVNVLPNYAIYKSLEASLLGDASNRGAYILVNDSSSKSLHETHDSAWRHRTNDYAFIGRIGMDDTSGAVLALDKIEKPIGFDDLSKR